MNVITFSEFDLGTENPVFDIDGNTVFTSGGIRSDSANPTSPVLAGSVNSFDPPISVNFEHPVDFVSFDAGFFDNLGSTEIVFFDSLGNILQRQFNSTGNGIETFSLSSEIGIAGFTVRAISLEEAGFAIDNLNIGEAILPVQLALEVPSASTEAITEIGVLDGRAGDIFIDNLGPNDPSDAFQFEFSNAVTVTWRVWRANDPDAVTEITADYDAGINQIRVLADQDLFSQQNYILELASVSITDDPKEQAIDDLSTTIARSLFKFAVLDLKDLALAFAATIETSADAINLYNGIQKKLGVAGILLDAGFRLNDALQADDVGRALFIETLDFFTATSLSLGAAAAGSWINPVAGVLSGLISGVVYTATISDEVRQLGADTYDGLPANSFEGPENAMAAEAVEFIQFDEDWYLETYSDALAAVTNGAYANAYLYYFAEGAALGHLPNATAQILDPEDLRDGNNTDLGNYEGRLSLANITLGDMRGDGISQPEAELVTRLNDLRTNGLELALNNELSAIANRKAFDLSHNFVESAIARMARDPDGWAELWADQQGFEEGIESSGLDLSNYQSLSFYAVAGTGLSAEEALSVFFQNFTSRTDLFSFSNTNVGIAEYGGIWVVILAETNQANDNITLSEDLSGVVRNGGTGADTLVLGTFEGELNGGEGDDALFGSDNNDQLNGGDGIDHITGNLGDDIINGGAGNDLITAGITQAFIIEAPREAGISLGSGLFALPVDATNNSIEDAIDVSGLFSFEDNPNIANAATIPHVTIQGTGNDNTHYYSLTVTGENVTLTFDIDFARSDTGSFDSFIQVFNETGELLSTNDDADTNLGGDGSISSLDSFTSINVGPGTYIVAVGAFPSLSNIPVDGTYELQISVAGDLLSPTPFEPASDNDIIDGGEGDDTLLYFGDRVNYQITENPDGGYVVADITNPSNRDEIINVEFIRFTNQDELNFNIGDLVTTGDIITGDDQDNILMGTALSDDFIAGAGDDRLSGLAGSDILRGQAGRDTLNGGAGDDVISGGLDNDNIIGGLGADVLDGGAGFDTVRFTDSAQGITLDLGAGIGTGGEAEGDSFISIERVIGSRLRDTLTGSDAGDVLLGRGGRDIIDGGAGNDTLSGEFGRDEITGGLGDDTLFGGVSNDTFFAGLGADSHDGGEGIRDTVDYRGSTAVTVDLGNNLGVGGWAEGDTFTQIERIIGSFRADNITGSEGRDFLNGVSGDDMISGAGGNDRISAGGGNDIVLGGQGDDLLIGGGGDDRFRFFGDETGRDIITDFGGGDVIELIDFADLSTLDDILALATQQGSDVVIRFNEATTLTLSDVTVSDLDVDTFVFG